MYGKIFDQMYESSVCEDWKVLVTFQQFIILSDKDGTIDMTPESIARRTNIPLEIIKHGIEILEKPDPRSRTPQFDGRRIIRIDDHRDWGWFVVNKAQYRKIISKEEKKEADRIRIAEKRKKDNDSNNVAHSRNLSVGVADVAHTDADTNTNTEIPPIVPQKQKQEKDGGVLKNEEKETTSLEAFGEYLAFCNGRTKELKDEITIKISKVITTNEMKNSTNIAVQRKHFCDAYDAFLRQK